jgi:hypothetical protein
MAGLDNIGSVPPEVAVPQKTQTEDAFSTMLKSSQERALAGQRALDARRDQLLQLSQKRMFDPTLMRFAGAMLAPTKTGSFGESLGYGATAAAEEQEKEFARQQAFAKLQYEMEVESAKQKQAAMLPQLLMGMRQERALPAAAGVPQAVPVESGAQAAPAAPAAAPTPQITSAQAKTLFAGKSDADLQLAMGIPELKPFVDAELALRKERRESMIPIKIGGEERRVYPEELEEMKRLSKSGDIAGLKGWYRVLGIEPIFVKDPSVAGGERLANATELEEMKERSKAEFGKQEERSVPYQGKIQKIQMDPSQYSAWKKASEQGKGDEYIARMLAGTAVPPSEREQSVEAEGQKTTATKRAEASVTKETQIISAGDSARERILLAEELNKFATDPSKAKIMAILEKATPESAFGKLLSEGIAVGTFRVGIPQLREIVTQAGGKEEDVRNLQQLGNIYTRLMFMNGNLFEGQGAVSNYEREMQTRMAGTVQDTPLVAQARANYVITRSKFDKAISNSYQNWLDNNKGGTFDKYKRTPEYEKLENSYMNRVRAIGDKFFPDMSTGSSNASSSSTSGGSTRPASGRPRERSPAGSADRFLNQ